MTPAWLSFLFSSHDTSAVPHLSGKVIVTITTWIVAWCLRARRQSPSAAQDLILYGVAGCYTWWNSLSMIACFILTTTTLILLYTSSQSTKSSSTTKAGLPMVSNEDPAMKPMILPSRTTHTRLFPTKHSFSYSYLLVGIPIGWRANSASFLSIDTSSSNGWLHVDASDFLERSDMNLSLEEKLRTYLKSQGVDENEFPHAYLVTAPRILGYSFNPVSFWYLYSARRELKAMILEVNNTFDERRMYFLNRQTASTNKETSSVQLNGSADNEVGPSPALTDSGRIGPFSASWAKDFHVSPFNSRDGTYSLVAKDPMPFQQQGCSSVSNTITLLSPEKLPKLVARISSIIPPTDPTRLTGLSKFKFLALWAWVGFLTFPRILRQAWKLFFAKKLKVWYRPEVTESSIARRETSSERCLELFFSRYLCHSVEHLGAPLHLIYIPPSAMGRRLELFTPTCASATKAPDCLEIRVISPSFYSRFVHYAHTTEAFDREFLCADSKNRTVLVSRPDLLSRLFPRLPEDRPPVSVTLETLPLSRFDRARWAFLRNVRCPPTAVSYGEPATTRTEVLVSDIRPLRLSPLDAYVASSCADHWKYRRHTTLLFLSGRFAGGFPIVLQVVNFAARLGLILVGWGWVSINNCKDFSSRIGLELPMLISATAVDLAFHNAVHIWDWAKGL